MTKVKKQVKSQKNQYTKEQFATVIDMWETKSNADIARELGLKTQHVSYMGAQIRRAGYQLPKKHTVGVIQSLIQEVLKEKKLIK